MPEATKSEPFAHQRSHDLPDVLVNDEQMLVLVW